MIAIHYNKSSFASGWIQYCQENEVDHKIVNCFDNDIIDQIQGCRALIWHFHHADFKDSIVARQILNAVEHSGVKVFPNFKTAWHFDDKVGQKYLFEALGLPSVKAYVFFSKEQALKWLYVTDFPKVFKLRKGAGSHCVELVKTRKDAIRLVNKSFGCGHSIYKPLNIFYDRYRAYLRGKETFLGVIKSLGRIFIKPVFFRYAPRERGYVYFQDFVANNPSDIRVIIIGEFAFFIRRANRPGDFRASGGGLISYAPDENVKKCVAQAFLVNERIQSQCIAFDFLIDSLGSPLFVEVSYGFDVPAYDKCVGYFDQELNWYTGTPNFHKWMIDQVILNTQ